MRTKTLQRRQILRALRTEPLKAGNWARGPMASGLNTGHYRDQHQPPCEVCAVGAVVNMAMQNGSTPTAIRVHVLAEKWCEGYAVKWNDECHDVYTPEELARAGHYWNALSIYFESFLRVNHKTAKRIVSKDRDKLCNFVKKHFPKEIEVELGS